MMDDMERIVICKYCNQPEYYGKMRWLSGKCCCRNCYRTDYEVENKRPYTWDDLDGERPTIDDYKRQNEPVKPIKPIIDEQTERDCEE